MLAQSAPLASSLDVGVCVHTRCIGQRVIIFFLVVCSLLHWRWRIQETREQNEVALEEDGQVPTGNRHQITLRGEIVLASALGLVY